MDEYKENCSYRLIHTFSSKILDRYGFAKTRFSNSVYVRSSD